MIVVFLSELLTGADVIGDGVCHAAVAQRIGVTHVPAGTGLAEV